MKFPRRDTLSIGCLVLAAILAVWLGLAGPIFNIDPKKLNDSAGLAAWLQTFVAAIAIVAVYVAATIPVRAENQRREQDLKLRRQGLALLIIPEVLTLKGEVETAIHSGTIYNPPVQPPTSLVEKLGELYILGEIGGRLLQTVGMIRGMAVQTLRFQARGMVHGAPVQSMTGDGQKVWQNHTNLLQLCLVNLDEAIEQLQLLVSA